MIQSSYSSCVNWRKKGLLSDLEMSPCTIYSVQCTMYSVQCTYIFELFKTGSHFPKGKSLCTIIAIIIITIIISILSIVIIVGIRIITIIISAQGLSRGLWFLVYSFLWRPWHQHHHQHNQHHPLYQHQNNDKSCMISGRTAQRVLLPNLLLSLKTSAIWQTSSALPHSGNRFYFEFVGICWEIWFERCSEWDLVVHIWS